MKSLRVGWLSAALFSLGLLLTACGSDSGDKAAPATTEAPAATEAPSAAPVEDVTLRVLVHQNPPMVDRKSTRLNSSHKPISYAVFCLKKKTRK